MRISAEEKEKLREKILAEAAPFLKKTGSSGAPVDEIMKNVGLTSGALYSHFKSKEDFFVQVLLRELDYQREVHRQQIEKHGPRAFSKFIERYLSDEHVNAVAQGCLFVALGADMHRQKAGIRAMYEEKIEALFATIAEGLSSGSYEERLAKVRFAFSAMVGAITFARTLKTAEAAHEILSTTKKQLLKMI
jgi:TetR/AcrR family transcriptional repressor of nem operon